MAMRRERGLGHCSWTTVIHRVSSYHLLILTPGHGSQLLEDVMNLLGMPSCLNIVRDDAGEDPGYPHPARI